MNAMLLHDIQFHDKEKYLFNERVENSMKYENGAFYQFQKHEIIASHKRPGRVESTNYGNYNAMYRKLRPLVNLADLHNKLGQVYEY
jgi:hypothetical protein